MGKTQRIRALEAKARELRYHIVDMVYTAQSGHCGGSLSSADIVAALYFDFLNIDPANPSLPDRDRFVLSKGHACPVQYGALAMRGFFPIEELHTLRKLHSRLQGHPVAGKLPGLEVTSGSLGIGFCEAVGLALDARLRAGAWKVWTVLGDGELNEGSVWEAAQAAVKFKLGNLIAIVDRNGLQNDGYCCDIMPMDSVNEKFRSFGWAVLEMDGHNMGDIVATFEKALVSQAGSDADTVGSLACSDSAGVPVCIVAKTVKGKGVSFMEDVRDWHGKVPNAEQYAKAVAELRVDPEQKGVAE